MIKSLCTLFSCLLFMSLHAQERQFNDSFERLIQSISYNDKIDYGSIDIKLLEEARSGLKELDRTYELSRLSVPTVINIYNFLVISSIHKQSPVASVKDIEGFFENKHRIGSEYISLDELEERLIERTKDPSIHLLLNCGARSCPHLRFIANEQDIGALSTSALLDPRIITIDNTKEELFLSRIFYWYQNDFGTKEQLLKYISDKLERSDIITYKIKYLPYDWGLNTIDQEDYLLFYPTKLYRRSGFELKVFNNYYSQTENDIRSNFYSGFFQFQFGTNKNYNWGFDLKLRSVTQGKTSLFDALRFKNEVFHLEQNTMQFSRIGISGFGPSIRYQPFRDKANINIIHSLYFVPMSDAEGNENYGYSDFEGLQIFNKIYIEKELSLRRRLFFDVGLWIENLPILRDTESFFTQIQVPFTVIYSFYPHPNLSYYALANIAGKTVYNKFDQENTRWDINAYTQLGLGLKYYLTEFLELEILYTYFYDGTPGRKAQTFNLGLRFFKF